jgi:hypothetical protein
MKLGAENKKSVYALTLLGLVAAYMVYTNLFSGPSYKTVTPESLRNQAPADTAAAAPATPAAPAAPPKNASSGPDISQAKGRVSKAPSSKGKNGEFHPVYQSKKPSERPDVSTIDPTIRVDLLEKAMKIPAAGGERDLFQILKTPPVKAVLASADDPKIRPFIPYGPRTPPPPPPPPGPPPEKPPAQITFKFYGTSAVHPDGTRTAYFIIPGATPDADRIFMASEGQVVEGHFRIVQISPDKCTVEDVTDKRRQPLNMERETTQ